jgi:transcription initiation factor TFIID subunit 7
MDQPELEKEVRRLFRYDAEAIDVKWEVLTIDEKPVTDAGQTSGHIQSSGAMSGSGGGLRRNDASSMSMDVGEFGPGSRCYQSDGINLPCAWI